MVPGSTFRYGSHFWRVTRRPRLSSKQPIEAAATPLPSEETTPPVTNIYFGPVRKALEILRESRRTLHYGQKPSECQITFSNCRYLGASSGKKDKATTWRGRRAAFRRVPRRLERPR